ncbi:MAG TPA: phosphatidylglycerol lysyltransferase domain-containing protein [Candidatus Wallbacteria bacterium]|nr:phosphatidylglycerol lysyltransferase domain-containing protein [Candidatus Wallbacteria bacterium]
MICISTSPNLILRNGLTKIDLQHKPSIEKYFKKENINISDYTFANNYIWFENADGFMAEINDNLCMFIYNDEALTLLLPPVGGHSKNETLRECFKIMNKINANPNDSKADYVYADFLNNVDFEAFEVERQNPDYVYISHDLTELRGNKYKTKRNENNYFIKNYNFQYSPYSFIYRDAAMDLLYRWANLRLISMGSVQNLEHFVELMELERKAITRALDHHEELGLKGAVITIDGRIEGITFGEKINETTASVLIEKTNFQFFGISQFLFKEFCRNEFSDCAYVNVGDDLGFENLRKVKMSYHPYEYIPKYTIRQKQVIL